MIVKELRPRVTTTIMILWRIQHSRPTETHIVEKVGPAMQLNVKQRRLSRNP